MELIQKENIPDWVHICLPSYLHAEYAIAVMEAGMDVFIEKPVCSDRNGGKKTARGPRENGKNCDGGACGTLVFVPMNI